MQSIGEALAAVVPAVLCARLREGPGWRAESGGVALAWTERSSSAPDGGVAWTLTHPSGLRAECSVEIDRPLNAARVRVALINDGGELSPPLSAIKPLYLIWQELGRDGVTVRAVSGGVHAGYYPPHAFRDHAAAFLPSTTGPGRVEGGPLRIESGPDGRSSNGHLPILQMRIGDAGLVAALEWSGLWYQQIGSARWDQDLVWEAGIPVRDLVLAPNERLDLPTVHLIAFRGDDDDGGNACRRYVYDRICPDLDGYRPVPPLSYDHWFGIFNEFDEPLMRRQADRAAELGLEYFAVDAGWFAGCGAGSDFSSGVGNLGRVDRNKFPHGLEPLANYSRDRGLKFGLWFELERAHRDSDLAREHPEWMIDVGAPFLHANFGLSAVQDHAIELVSGWIERLGLEWGRWDYNFGPRVYWERADPTGKIQFAYLSGLYRVLDTLMARHPRWLIEACAGGGRRIDFGTLRRSHTTWFSDYTGDAPVCRTMQSGANRFLPGHLLNSAVCVWRGAGGAAVSTSEVLSRMCGALSFNGDIADWSSETAARIAECVAAYRDFRHLLVADFYPLTPQPTRPEDGESVQFCSRDGAEAIVFSFAGITPTTRMTVRLRGVVAEDQYLVWDPFGSEEIRRQGHELLSEGLTLPLLSGAAVRRLRRVD
ncbi:MAG: alpha-galactosidase [Chloroflexota bacterium]|nr:MAG: alpha-galactosidase [Chloroflexota bacterium]